MDGIFGGLSTDVAQIDEHPYPIHLGDYFAAEVRKTSIMTLITAATDAVGCVVGELHDTYAQFLEQLYVWYVVSEACCVLPT